MNRFLIKATCITLCLWMLSGCIESPDRNINYTLYVTHASLEMIEGDEMTIVASPTTETFTWASSDPSVATVNNGLVRAIKDGVCIITVTGSGGLSREIPVDVDAFRPLTGVDVINTQNLSHVTSLSLSHGQTFSFMEPSPLPADYNERIPFDVVWTSSAPDIISVDEKTGAVTSVDFGDAVITVSVVDKPSVKADIPVSTAVIPITDIQVPVTSLDLFQYELVTISPVRVPANYSVPDASLKWESSNNTVVSVANGAIEGAGEGTATVTVSLNSNPAISKTISVTVTGAPGTTTTMDFSTFTDNGIGDNLSYKKVAFDKGCIVEIPGMTAAQIEECYNFDFFSYNPAKNILIFTGETGAWDVYYSSVYKFIWVRKDNDSNWPEGTWGRGGGFTQARAWHADLNGSSGGYNWGLAKIRFAAYFKRIGNDLYQTHIYVSPSGMGWMNLVEDLALWYNHPNNYWTLVAPEGFSLNASGSDVSATAAATGYYRVLVDYSARTRTYIKVY